VEEQLNSKALEITQRIEDKLTGGDFEIDNELDVSNQVNRLILQATASENLCQCYLGWCPFW
jgi:FKBP12-rapamycin complex-associated protein